MTTTTLHVRHDLIFFPLFHAFITFTYHSSSILILLSQSHTILTDFFLCSSFGIASSQSSILYSYSILFPCVCFVHLLSIPPLHAVSVALVKFKVLLSNLTDGIFLPILWTRIMLNIANRTRGERRKKIYYRQRKTSDSDCFGENQKKENEIRKFFSFKIELKSTLLNVTLFWNWYRRRWRFWRRRRRCCHRYRLFCLFRVFWVHLWVMAHFCGVSKHFDCCNAPLMPHKCDILLGKWHRQRQRLR